MRTAIKNHWYWRARVLCQFSFHLCCMPPLPGWRGYMYDGMTYLSPSVILLLTRDEVSDLILAKGIPALRNRDMTSIRAKLCADSTACVRPVPLRSSAWRFWYTTGYNFSTLSPAATPEHCELLFLYRVGQRRFHPEWCFSLGTGSYGKSHNRAARLKR